MSILSKIAAINHLMSRESERETQVLGRRSVKVRKMSLIQQRTGKDGRSVVLPGYRGAARFLLAVSLPTRETWC